MRDDPFAGINDDYETNLAALGAMKVVEDYDPAKFYCRSTNKFDHSVKVQSPFPNDIVAAIDKVVNLRLVPEYTSRHALIRDAVVHRLHFLVETFGDWEIGELLALERVVAAAEARRALRVRQKEILETAEVELRELSQDADWESLEAELAQLEAALPTLTEHYQRKLAVLIDQHRASLRRFAS